MKASLTVRISACRRRLVKSVSSLRRGLLLAWLTPLLLTWLLLLAWLTLHRLLLVATIALHWWWLLSSLSTICLSHNVRLLLLAGLLHLLLRHSPVLLLHGLTSSISLVLTRLHHRWCAHLLRNLRSTWHLLDCFILLHVADHLEVSNVLLWLDQPVIELIVEVKSLFSHLREHLNLHLSLTELHKELVCCWVSDSTSRKLLNSCAISLDNLGNPSAFFLSCFIGCKTSLVKLDLFVEGFLFGSFTLVSSHKVFNTVECL